MLSESARESFITCVEKLKNGSASPSDIVEATTQWIDVIENDRVGIDEQVSKRTAWLFPNNLLLVVCRFFGPTIVYCDDALRMDTPAPLPEEIQNEWRVSLPANGWYQNDDATGFPQPDSVFELIQTMTHLHGTPKLVIPWISTWAKDAVDYGEDYWAGDLFRKAVQDMFAIAINGGLGVQSPWELEFTSERTYLPKDCHFMQLMKLLHEVQHQKIALVGLDIYRDYFNDDETKEWLRKENPEVAHLPIIYLNKYPGVFFGNGWIQEAIIVVDDAEVEKKIYKLVEDLQLDFSLPWSPEDVIEGESWEPDGVLTVTSEWN